MNITYNEHSIYNSNYMPSLALNIIFYNKFITIFITMDFENNGVLTYYLAPNGPQWS